MQKMAKNKHIYLDVKIDKCVLMILNEWHGTYEGGEIAKYMEIIFLKCFFVFRMFEYCMKNVKLFSTDLLSVFSDQKRVINDHDR